MCFIYITLYTVLSAQDLHLWVSSNYGDITKLSLECFRLSNMEHMSDVNFQGWENNLMRVQVRSFLSGNIY